MIAYPAFMGKYPKNIPESEAFDQIETTSIVAAAVRWKGVTISLPRPARHHHILHSMCEPGWPEDAALTCIQGFIDSNGDFYDRKTAKQLVKATGQQTIADHQPHELFSEDLW